MISDVHLSTIATYSIIPTLLAVCVGLWWGSMETDFRTLQPYLAMTRRPVTFANGVNLSYQSSYLLWAAIKAAFHSHWLLTFVCTGAFFSQACMMAFLTQTLKISDHPTVTVTMSALWQEVYEYRNSSIMLQQNLELRTIPSWMTTSTNDPSGLYDGVVLADASVLSSLYGQLQTNWLYSAIIQMSLNGTEPAWSSEGWSFVPIDLSSLNDVRTDQNPADGSDSSDAANTSGRLLNALVTVTTPAVRARLQCSPYEALSNVSSWVTAQDFTNTSIWNVTANPSYPRLGYTLGCGVLMILKPNYSSPYPCDYEEYTSFLAHDSEVQCCENNTAGSNGEAIVAYWSPNSKSSTETASNNFTVKWIHGKPVAGFQKTNVTYEPYEDYVPFTVWPQNTVMAWPEVPRMAALNCMPIISKASASVIVDQHSGRVQSFSILGDLVDDDSAWTDSFVAHNSQSSEDYGGDGDNMNVTTR